MHNTKELESMSKGALYFLGGNGLWFAFDYLFILLIARISGPQVVGLFFLTLTIVNIAAVFSLMGLHKGVLRFVSMYIGREQNLKLNGAIYFTLVFVSIFSMVVALFLFAVAPVVARFFHDQTLISFIRIFSLCFPFIALSKVLLSSFQAFQEIKYYAFLHGIVLPVSMIIVYLLLMNMCASLYSLGLAYLFSYVLVCFLMLRILIKKCITKAVDFEWSDCKPLFLFSLPLTFVGLLSLTNGQFDALVLAYFRTVKEVGIYTVVFKVSLVCAAVLASINYVFCPVIANLHGKNDVEKLGKIFKVVTRWIITSSLPIYFILVVNSAAILAVLGEDYSIGALPLIVLCTGQLVNFSSGSVGMILTMIGKSFLTLANYAFFVILNLILDFIFIPFYGILGAALALAIALALLNVVKIIQVYLIVKIHPYDSKLLDPVLLSVTMFMLFYFLCYYFSFGVIYRFSLSVLFAFFYMAIIIIKLPEEDRSAIRVVFNSVFGKVKYFCFWLDA